MRSAAPTPTHRASSSRGWTVIWTRRRVTARMRHGDHVDHMSYASVDAYRESVHSERPDAAIQAALDVAQDDIHVRCGRRFDCDVAGAYVSG